MRVKPYAAEHSVTAVACVMRMAESCMAADATMLGDAWFGYVQVYIVPPPPCDDVLVRAIMILKCDGVPHAAVKIGKMSRNFIGVMKTAHGLFPKAFLKSHLTLEPAGSGAALSATVDGVDLVTVVYKYNMRKGLFFVATTAGAGALDNGNPYIER